MNTGNGQLPNGLSTYLSLQCPIVTDGSATQGVNVYGYSNGLNDSNIGNNSLEAEVCDTWSGGGGAGGACGAATGYNGGAAVVELAGVNAADYNTSDFVYVQVYLGKMWTGGDNVLFGYQNVLLKRFSMARHRTPFLSAVRRVNRVVHVPSVLVGLA